MDKNLLEIINQALDKQGMSARQASILAAGTPELIRNMRRGRVPSVERFRALCDVLNIEFYIGPTRSKSTPLVYPRDKREDMYEMLKEIISRLPSKEVYPKTTEPAVPPYDSPKADNVHRIQILETNKVLNKTLHESGSRKLSYVAFQTEWFEKHNIYPKDCVILEVHDELMEPTVPNSSVVLIDRSRRRRQVGHIYAVRLNDDVIIRRVDKSGDEWQLVCDNPKSAAIPFPPEAAIIGEVKWLARTF